MKDKFYNNKILCIFLLLQPFIDILTSFMTRYLDVSITIGSISRFLFLIYAIIYLIFINKEHKKFKIIYFFLFAIYLIGFTFTNCINSLWFSELYYWKNRE